MGRTAYATLIKDHLIHNWQVLRSAAPSSSVWAMVKANAYGHGIRSVSQRLAPYLRPQDALGVASIDEALALRQAGVSASIALIEGVFEPEELKAACEHNLIVIFHSPRQVEWLKQSVLPCPIRAWVKVNTGMGRLGFPFKDAVAMWKEVESSPCVRGPVGVMSHLACSDEKDHPHNAFQLESFSNFQSLGAPLGICNSAAIFHWPNHHYDVVRPGLALYGASPISGKTANELGLKPVMSLHTNLIALHYFSKGESVGYGSTFMCPEDMPVGIIAMGYGDGYPRLTKSAPVMVNGVVCNVVGRVSMDMMAIDLRPCESQTQKVKEGDSVLLWGQNHLGYLPVENVVQHMDRSPYDLMTSVQHRVRFTWV